MKNYTFTILVCCTTLMVNAQSVKPSFFKGHRHHSTSAVKEDHSLSKAAMLPDSSDYYNYQDGGFVPTNRNIYHYNGNNEVDTLWEKNMNTGVLTRTVSYTYHSAGKESLRMEEIYQGGKRKFEKRYDAKGNIIFDMEYQFNEGTQQYDAVSGDSIIVTYDGQNRPIEEITYRWNYGTKTYDPRWKTELQDYEAKGPSTLKNYNYDNSSWEIQYMAENIKWHTNFDLYELYIADNYFPAAAYVYEDDGGGLMPSLYDTCIFVNNKPVKFIEFTWDGNTMDSSYIDEYIYDSQGNLSEYTYWEFDQGVRQDPYLERMPKVYGPSGEKLEEQYHWYNYDSAAWLPLYKEIYYYSVVSSVSKEQATLHISAYPNPVTDMLMLGGELSATNTIHIFDMNGRKMKQVVVTREEPKVLMNDLQSGIYLVQITNDTGTAVLKIAK